jgi:molybdopterin converting factor small subunit
MNVTVILVGPFRINRFHEEVREYPSATCVQDVIDDLKLPIPLLGTVLINGIHAGVEDLLHDGDTVCLLPFMDGG